MAIRRLMISTYPFGPMAPVGSGGPTSGSFCPSKLGPATGSWGDPDAAVWLTDPTGVPRALAVAACFSRSYRAGSATRYPWEDQNRRAASVTEVRACGDHPDTAPVSGVR